MDDHINNLKPFEETKKTNRLSRREQMELEDKEREQAAKVINDFQNMMNN